MTQLAFLVHVPQSIGYPVIIALVMAESSGVPVPGETALITGALLAGSGKLDIVAVIALAAAGAIIGDNLGYVIGRKGGRYLLQRPGRFERQRREVLRTGEPFFERHGPKAVFFGRWLLGLRVWASWLAGATRMRWTSFLFWNALGGITWAITVGLLAYFVGNSVKNAISGFGIFGLIAIALTAGGVFLIHRRHRRAGQAKQAAADRSGQAPAAAERTGHP